MSARTERLRRFEKQRKHRRISWRRVAIGSGMHFTHWQNARSLTHFVAWHIAIPLRVPLGMKVRRP